MDKYDYRGTCEKYSGIAVVAKDGKFGYVNDEGVEITPLKYNHARTFRGNTGMVKLGRKWGLVDKQGKEVIPPVFNDIIEYFGNAPAVIVRIGKKFGFLNVETGELLTPVKYDKVERWTQIGDFLTDDVRKDLARVRLDGKWGCVNLRGDEIIPLKYDEICISQMENPRIAAKLDGKWGFINDDGKEVTAFEYDDLEIFFSGRARVKKGGKYGFINSEGSVVIPLIYDDCERHFRNEGFDKNKRILPILVKRGDKYGFIDIAGNACTLPKYEFALPFECFKEKSWAAVVLNGKTGFINEAGKTVIPFMYEPDFEAMNNYRFRGSFVNVKFNGKLGVIDAQNRVVIPFLYDRILDDGIGFLNALRDGKELCIDTRGNEWEVNKNPDARTFKDYIHAVEWVDVAKSAVSLHYVNDAVLEIYEENFNTFRNKRYKPFNGIIRIFENTDKYDCDNRPVVAKMFWAEDRHSYTFFDWDEILDMEVRIEDNLTLTDADVVAACINRASDNGGFTEKSIKRLLDMYADKNYNA